MRVEPKTFQTAATDDDKDWRLYQNGQGDLFKLIAAGFGMQNEEDYSPATIIWSCQRKVPYKYNYVEAVFETEML